MNTHSLCTQNALHSPASVQISLAGSLPVTQKSTIPLARAGIAAWRICRYNLDTVPDIHANKAVEAGVQTSCPFQYKCYIKRRTKLTHHVYSGNVESQIGSYDILVFYLDGSFINFPFQLLRPNKIVAANSCTTIDSNINNIAYTM